MLVSATFGPVLSTSLGVYQMQMGQLALEVSSGDITKETCDVIVNSSNQTFNLKAGECFWVLKTQSLYLTVQSQCDVWLTALLLSFLRSVKGDLGRRWNNSWARVCAVRCVPTILLYMYTDDEGLFYSILFYMERHTWLPFQHHQAVKTENLLISKPWSLFQFIQKSNVK